MNNKFLAMLGCGLLALSCGGPKGSSSDETESVATTKTYTVYEFGNVNSTNIRWDSAKVHSVTASKQGMVYVAGQAGNVAVIDRTDGQTWVNLDLTTGVTPTGNNRSFASDDADAKISITAALSDGVIIYEPISKVIGILHDTSPGATTAWKIGDAGFDEDPLAFYEVKSSASRYIYASTFTNDVDTKDGLRFWQFGSPDDNWKKDFTKDGTNQLDEFYHSFAIGLNGDLLLGTEDGEIFEIDKGSFGAANAAGRKLKNVIPFVSHAAVKHEASTDTGAIKKMLLVDNRYLLVGFWKEWNDPSVTSANTGGLFYKDMSDDSAPWKNAGSEYSVTGIIADRHNPKRAVIATGLGAMIFENGEIQELVPGEKIITKNLIDDSVNRGNLGHKAAAKSGFSGSVDDSNMGSVAQAKDGKFYFATGNGVATMVITSKDL